MADDDPTPSTPAAKAVSIDPLDRLAEIATGHPRLAAGYLARALKALAVAAALIALAGPAVAQSSHCYWNRERGYGPVLVCESQVNTGKEIVSRLCAASSIDARCNTVRTPAPLPPPHISERYVAPKVQAGK
jgi:hypothetical protein